MMRVLHITTFLQGGAGRNITDLALAQHRAGYDVLVVADAGGEPGYSSYPEYLAELETAGVPFVELTSTFKRDVALNTHAAEALQRITGGWRPDLVHAHATTPAVVARLARLGAVTPFLNTMHGWGIAKTPVQKTTDIAVLELANAVVVPSAAAATMLAAEGLRRDVRVIPYGLPLDPPSAAPDPMDVQRVRRTARGRRICLCIGTIGERKNQRLLVDALATAAAQDIVAVFIGDGDAVALEEHARARSVADRILVLGHRSRACRYLSLADVLVLPSRNEGLPFAVLEALRAGVPVVGTNVCEIAEALDGGRCGYLVAPDDATALSEAIRVALGPSPALRVTLRKRFEELYTSTRMFRQYSRLYDELAA